MGNDISSYNLTSGNALFLRTDKPFYFAGEMVTGSIYLNVCNGNFPGAQVTLKVKGEEKCKWTETEHQSHLVPGSNPPVYEQRTITHHYDGESTFYRNQVPLQQFQQQYIPPGQYNFPFQFQLRSDLPGTFKSLNTTVEAHIWYRLKAEIMHVGGGQKLKFTQDLTVHEQQKTMQQPLFGERVANIKSCCCIGQGTTNFKCAFDKNTYLPGETAQIFVDVDNSNCDLDINSISAHLTNTLTLKSKQGKTKILTHQVAFTSTAGVQAKETATNEKRKIMSLNLTNNQSYKPLEPSTNGSIVSSTYTISAQAELGGFMTCCSDDVSCGFRAQIIAAPVPGFGQPVVAPSGWQPTVYQPTVVQFDPSQMYQPKVGGVALAAPQMPAQQYQPIPQQAPPMQQSYPPQQQQQQYPPQQPPPGQYPPGQQYPPQQQHGEQYPPGQYPPGQYPPQDPNQYPPQQLPPGNPNQQYY